MNTLKLKLNPYKDINIASLDDKPLSPYSELNNYMKEPFLSWASKLLDAAEREINDDYCLEVVSESFEALFLEGMQNNFDSCKEYRTASFQVNTSTSERFDLIRKLASKYAVNYSIEAFKLPVYTNIQLSLDATMVKSVTLEDAKLIVTKEKEIKNQLSAALEGSIILLISDKTGIGNCTLTCIAKEGGCSTTCNVLVESTFKKRENAHGMLSLTAMLAVACIFCAALSPVLCVPVAIATVVCGVLAIARNKGDRFWAFILMAVAVLTALEVTGITNWL